MSDFRRLAIPASVQPDKDATASAAERNVSPDDTGAPRVRLHRPDGITTDSSKQSRFEHPCAHLPVLSQQASCSHSHSQSARSSGTAHTGRRGPFRTKRAVTCRVRIVDAPAPSAAAQRGNAHKVFDQATIVCRSGAGGRGEIAEAGKGRLVPNYKYKHNRGMKKEIWLPTSEPAEGQQGGDVYLVADPSVDSLLHLHERREWAAKDGANGNPATGSGGPKRGSRKPPPAAPLRIPVPMGTVVRTRKRIIGELIQVGDTCCICEGGKGGRGVVAPSAAKNAAAKSKKDRKLEDKGIEVVEVEDRNWRADARGLAGAQMQVTLQLRVVADAGFVGLPNVGKTSLLRRITRANAAVANYPFTTLMPNLGVMTASSHRADSSDNAGRAGADADDGDGTRSVLVDLPGLIEGAHTGRGLGRMFLRHLARTSVVVHVVDAAADDPAADYWTVREELRMYNPEYCTRPCIVALNKMDLPDAAELQEEVMHEVKAMAETLRKAHPEIHLPPTDVLCCSAETGAGVDQLVAAIEEQLAAVRAASSDADAERIFDWDTSLPDTDPRFPEWGEDGDGAASSSDGWDRDDWSEGDELGGGEANPLHERQAQVPADIEEAWSRS